MAWQAWRWVWRLESPLCIGSYPAGMLNRTRLYIPARTMWGALTSVLARSCHCGFPDYSKVGEQVRKNVRFSYLYPAQRAVNDEYVVWLPKYEAGSGYIWQSTDGKRLLDRQFQMRLVTSRPGTAIAPSTDSAEEGTLREHDLISQYWLLGNPSEKCSWELRNVYMVGYVFLLEEEEKTSDEPLSLLKTLEDVGEIFIGADSRYGLGRLKRVAFHETSKDPCEFFGTAVKLNSLTFKTDHLLAHVCAEALNKMSQPNQGATGKVEINGDLEKLAGWDFTKQGKEALATGQLCWVPGSVSQRALRFTLNEDGLWEVQEAADGS